MTQWTVKNVKGSRLISTSCQAAANSAKQVEPGRRRRRQQTTAGGCRDPLPLLVDPVTAKERLFDDTVQHTTLVGAVRLA